MYTNRYTGRIENLAYKEVFVYGANRQGRHGMGAALYARSHYGAIHGKVGLQGMSYGVITKELRRNYPPVTLEEIAREVDKLIICCNEYPEYRFICTAFGTGLAGFTHKDMREIFSARDIPINLILPKEWIE